MLQPQCGSSSKGKHELSFDPEMTHLHIPKRNESICLYKNLHMNVHSSTIHNSQKVKTTQMSNQLDEWINKHGIYIQ